MEYVFCSTEKREIKKRNKNVAEGDINDASILSTSFL